MRCPDSYRDLTARVIVAMVVALGVTCVYAAGDMRHYTARITAPGAQVFSGPGENYYATDTLAQGDAVEVYREEPNGWLGIRPPAESFSWVFAHHVKMLDSSLAEIDKPDVPSRIGSRLGDHRNAVQVRLKKGERVEILGERKIGDQLWYKIAPPAGEFRWIQAQSIAASNDVIPTSVADDTMLTASAAIASAPAPIVTVPIGSGTTPAAIIATGPVTLVADSQPSSPKTNDSDWRAVPLGSMPPTAVINESSDLAAPPLVEAGQQAALPPPPSPFAPGPSVTTPVATATPSVSTQSVPQPSSTPVAIDATGDLSRRLTDIEMRLSRIVAEPPATWQTEPLSREAEQLRSQAQTTSERAAVESTCGKIERFAAIGRRYRQAPLVAGQGVAYGAGSGDPRTAAGAPLAGIAPAAVPRAAAATNPLAQPPITPVGGADPGIVGPDGQRYDAVGILRPVVSKRPGAPQFALLNDRGQVVSFVTSSPDVNLQPYVGQHIGVTGSRGYIPEFQRAHVTAGRVAVLGEQRLLR